MNSTTFTKPHNNPLLKVKGFAKLFKIFQENLTSKHSINNSDNLFCKLKKMNSVNTQGFWGMNSLDKYSTKNPCNTRHEYSRVVQL